MPVGTIPIGIPGLGPARVVVCLHAPCMHMPQSPPTSCRRLVARRSPGMPYGIVPFPALTDSRIPGLDETRLRAYRTPRVQGIRGPTHSWPGDIPPFSSSSGLFGDHHTWSSNGPRPLPALGGVGYSFPVPDPSPRWRTHTNGRPPYLWRGPNTPSEVHFETVTVGVAWNGSLPEL
jgi:hypothetical protein